MSARFGTMASAQLGQPHLARHQRGGDREFEAELGLQPGRGRVVAQHGRLGAPIVASTFCDVVGAQVRARAARSSIAVDDAVRGVAHGVSLDGQAERRGCADSCPAREPALASALPARRQGGEEARRMLDRVRRGGEARRAKSAPPRCPRRGAAGMEGLGHAAEIGDQPARHAGGDAPAPAARGPHRAGAGARLRPPRRPRRTPRSGASPCGGAGRARARSARPRPRSRRRRRAAPRRRSHRGVRPRPGSPAPAPCWDGRPGRRRRSRAHAPAVAVDQRRIARRRHAPRPAAGGPRWPSAALRAASSRTTAPPARRGRPASWSTRVGEAGADDARGAAASSARFGDERRSRAQAGR